TDAQVKVRDNQHVIVGGLISQKKISFTKTNKTMAYISIEDLTGTVEVIVFPKDYERYQRYLNEDEKVFVVGRASVEDDKDGKIICERIVAFDEIGCDVWLQFATMEEYREKERILMDILYDSDGNDEVVLYIAATRQRKRLGKNNTVKADAQLLSTLKNYLGEKNVKVVEKSIEN
ncbi:MAG: DNA polymerase III subunit alpha, partial [Agathobacter sp.]|nr:DNA polymerase III subunit alpha [Agathobacter sp.]